MYDRLLYGDEHILSVPGTGIEETVERITVEDVRAFYEQYYTPELAEVVVVGDVEESEIIGKLDFFENLGTDRSRNAGFTRTNPKRLHQNLFG